MADTDQKMSRVVVGGMADAAMVVASADISLVYFLILRGVKQAAFINTIVTFANVIPIVVFIVSLERRLVSSSSSA
ncbi:hypothetical protein M3I53_08505 [Paraburkholderia sp. CNPSo 3272]|uniref:hypothetical protein n=1 Tax=Paraburkholderia sp. CNPSo 3272 TaxID=2940931 RepID=UPI0020B799CE|nr:hypothetical protein [Paraburkholderia sp. CNPSo 3272]MCP3723171.1 hypothetical protein [Paraburkholderia sp. CNPSo 3272]